MPPLPDIASPDSKPVPPPPMEESPPDAGLTFTAEQAATLGFIGAEPGAVFDVKVRISTADEMGVTAEPISAEPADEPEALDGGSEESVEPPKYGEKPKPAIKGPKSFGKPLPM